MISFLVFFGDALPSPDQNGFAQVVQFSSLQQPRCQQKYPLCLLCAGASGMRKKIVQRIVPFTQRIRIGIFLRGGTYRRFTVGQAHIRYVARARFRAQHLYKISAFRSVRCFICWRHFFSSHCLLLFSLQRHTGSLGLSRDFLLSTHASLYLRQHFRFNTGSVLLNFDPNRISLRPRPVFVRFFLPPSVKFRHPIIDGNFGFPARPKRHLPGLKSSPANTAFSERQSLHDIFL